MRSELMRPALFALALSGVGCGNVERFVWLPPSEAANVSARYHDRVLVEAVKSENGGVRPMIGVVVDDGAFVITSSNKRIPIDPESQLKIRIDYDEGDLALVEGGTVHKGISPAKIVAGTLLGVAGTAGVVGAIAGAASCGSPEAGGWFPDFGPALCGLAWGYFLAPGALAAAVAGIILAIRGSVPTNLTVSPSGYPRGAGAVFSMQF